MALLNTYHYYVSEKVSPVICDMIAAICVMCNVNAGHWSRQLQQSWELSKCLNTHSNTQARMPIKSLPSFQNLFDIRIELSEYSSSLEKKINKG